MNNSRLSNLRTNLISILLITGVILITFWPCLKADFVSWDDSTHLLENPLVHSFSLKNIFHIFKSTVNKTYIPLTILSFNLEHHFFGFNPFIYHLDNLLLHVANTVLIFLLMLRLGVSSRASLFISLFFGLHPMHVESVAWVTERKDLLYSFFYLLSLYHYVKYIKNPSWPPYLGSVLFGFLSILSKAMALSLPLVLLLCDWFFDRKRSQRVFLDKIPYVLLIAPIVWITYSLNTKILTVLFPQGFLIWIWTFAFYIQKFFFPLVLVPLYQLPQPISLIQPAYQGAIIIFIGTLCCLAIFRKNRLVLFGCLFYFSSIFFLWRFCPIEIGTVADRFMYLPSLGGCFLIGIYFDRVLKLERPAFLKPLFRLFLVAVFALLSLKTFYQCQLWQSSLSLWNSVLDQYPENATAHNNKGIFLSKAGYYDLAFGSFNAAIKSDPKYALAYYNRGKAHAELNQRRLAISDFDKALELKPDLVKAYNEKGILLAFNGENDSALDCFDKAIQIDPSFAKLYHNRSIVYKAKGWVDKALMDEKKEIQLSDK